MAPSRLLGMLACLQHLKREGAGAPGSHVPETPLRGLYQACVCVCMCESYRARTAQHIFRIPGRVAPPTTCHCPSSGRSWVSGWGLARHVWGLWGRPGTVGRGREALLEQEGPSVSALSPAGRGNRAVVKWRGKAGPDGGTWRGDCA